MRKRLRNHIFNNSWIVKADKVVTLNLERLGRQRAPTRRAADATKHQMVRLGLLDEGEALWCNPGRHITRSLSLDPHLEDTRDRMGLTVDKEGGVGKGNLLDQMEGGRERLLHTRLDKGSREDETNDRRRCGCMSDELLRKRSLTTKGRIAEDHAPRWKVNCQEVCLPNIRVFRVDIVANRIWNSGQEDTLSGRGLHPDCTCRSVCAKTVNA